MVHAFRRRLRLPVQLRTLDPIRASEQLLPSLGSFVRSGAGLI